MIWKFDTKIWLSPGTSVRFCFLGYYRRIMIYWIICPDYGLSLYRVSRFFDSHGV
jgi:hypothetical protein